MEVPSLPISKPFAADRFSKEEEEEEEKEENDDEDQDNVEETGPCRKFWGSFLR